MATTEQISSLRLLIGEPDDTNGWTDEKLGALYDAARNEADAARQVWATKAASAAVLVDVSESGSSRKLSDIQKNALAMAAYFKDLSGGETADPSDSPVVSRIRRGFA